MAEIIRTGEFIQTPMGRSLKGATRASTAVGRLVRGSVHMDNCRVMANSTPLPGGESLPKCARAASDLHWRLRPVTAPCDRRPIPTKGPAHAGCPRRKGS
jgi:hypothetical protein